MEKKLLIILIVMCCAFHTSAQEKRIEYRRKALDIGVYDYSKPKNNSYKIYYEEEADKEFFEVLMQSDRLKDCGIFGEYILRDNDSIEFFREQGAYEYCPELNYVMITGGHGYVSAYDLITLEEIFVNPSTYIYSPTRKYRFGTFEYDGMRYYIEVKVGETYTAQLITYAPRGEMTGIYWADDNTIHYLSERSRYDADDSKYYIGYSMQFVD